MPSFYTELRFDCSQLKEAQTHKYRHEMNLQKSLQFLQGFKILSLVLTLYVPMKRLEIFQGVSRAGLRGPQVCISNTLLGDPEAGVTL